MTKHLGNLDEAKSAIQIELCAESAVAHTAGVKPLLVSRDPIRLRGTIVVDILFLTIRDPKEVETTRAINMVIYESPTGVHMPSRRHSDHTIQHPILGGAVYTRSSLP